jgi:hypothetical protein
LVLEYTFGKIQENQEGLKLNGTHQRLVYAADIHLVQNVMVKWLTLLRILEVQGSNLNPETSYHDWGFRGFPQSFWANARIIPSFHNLSNSLFIYINLQFDAV